MYIRCTVDKVSNLTKLFALICTSYSARLKKHLSELESKHRITIRWSRNDSQYVEAKRAYLQEMQQTLKASLWATITRRHFLLKMKAKYAAAGKQ